MGRWFKELRVVLPIWLVSLLVTLMVFWIFDHVIQHGPFLQAQRDTDWFTSVAAWDGGWYLNIASNGYTSIQSTAFFPLYPLCIYILHIVGIPYPMGGFIISNVSLLLAVLFMYKLGSKHLDADGPRRSLVIFLTFPTAVFYNVIYTESLFLLLVVLFFYCLEEGRWFSAIIAGFFATVTRNLGVLLIVPAIIYWYRHRLELSRVQQILRLTSLSIVPLSLFLYMAYLGLNFHDPLAFKHAEVYWGRGFRIPIVTGVLAVYTALFHHSVATVQDANYVIMMLIDGLSACLFTLIGLGLIVSRDKAFTWEVKSFFVVYLLIATSTAPGVGDAESYARYVSVLFPAYFLLSKWMKSNVAMFAVVLLCTSLRILLTGMYGDGYWVT